MYKDGQQPEEGDQEIFTMLNLRTKDLYTCNLMCINPCGHWFGANELVNYYDRRAKNGEATCCPICRADFKPSDVSWVEPLEPAMQTRSAPQRWKEQEIERQIAAATLKHWQWYTEGRPHSELFLAMRDFFTQFALQQGVQVHSKPDDMSVEVSISFTAWWNPFGVTKRYAVVSADSTVVSARIVAWQSTQS